ncbi:MAG: BlaI/MecI/CopY family transcriptional regulator [Thermoplasmata archaeon]
MLGPLEKEVVSALESLQKAPTRGILAKLREKNVDVAYTTVSTILSRLYDKGLINRSREPFKGGERYIYIYKDIEKEYIDGLISGLVKVFGTKGLVHLSARIDQFSEKELEEMKKRLKL